MPFVDPEKRKRYQQEWNKNYYEKNRKAEISRVAKRKAVLRDWLNAYRKRLSCVHCGESHPACLDFHHTDPRQKDFSLGNVKAMGWGQEKLLSEIKKCVVVCANCHRKLHADGVR